MEDNKLIEKTNQVISKQNEMGQLISDLKVEVMKIRKENKYLLDRNSHLKSQLNSMLDKHDKDRVVLHKTAEEIIVDKPIREAIRSNVDENIIENQAEQVPESLSKAKVSRVERNNESDPEQTVFKDSSINRAAIFEFFLGKNIIAKIAGVLITLGIFTFGRMAYIEWLSDVQRFILLLLVGSSISVIGYLFDRKDSQLFSSIFYSIGIIVIAITFLLGKNTYALYSQAFFIALTLIMIGAVFVYFREKRYPFMDTMLLFIYTAITATNIITSRGDFSLVGVAIILSLNAILLGYIVFVYYVNYYKGKENGMLINSLIITLGIAVIVVTIGEANPSFIYIIWSMLAIAFAYLINIKLFSKLGYAKVIIAILTMILFIFGSLGITAMIVENNIVSTDSFGTLMAFLIFILALPIYIYLYVDEENDNVEVIDVYAVLLTVTLLVFTFLFGVGNSVNPEMMMMNRNILFGLELFVLLAISKLSLRSTHKILFIMVLAASVINGYMLISNTGGIFTQYIGYYIVGFITSVALIAENFMIERRTKKVHLDINQMLKTLLLLSSLLLVLMLVNSIKDSIFNRYNILYVGAIVYTLIGFRHLQIIGPLQDKYSEIYKVVTDGVIILFVLLSNLPYFDHDFSKGLDVITFIIILLPNIYVIYSFRTVFNYLKKFLEIDSEILFIILFKSGVLVQSLFIHFFINFTYDKVLLSSYFMVAAAIGVLFGFKENWKKVRYIGLGAIYFSLAKFFIYDFFAQNLSDTVRVITYISLGLVLLGISFLYSYLEKVYGGNEVL